MLVQCLDPTKFSEHNLFQILRGSLVASQENVKNILQFRNQFIFGWDSKKCVLLTLYLSKLNQCPINKIPVQKLILSRTPLFEINRIALNKEASKCALIGTRGIAVVHIPPQLGQVEEDSDATETEILSRCESLDENYFCKYKSLTIQQVRWHPSRSEGNYLVVLTSENALRLYCSNTKQLIKIFPLSNNDNIPRMFISKNRPLLASLGDTAVDFDFGPPLATSYGLKSDFQYRVFILRGNGDVCCIQSLFKNYASKLLLEGPLPLYPPSDDNYGIDDASSILVVWSMPPILVIATTTAVIYHTLIIEDDEEMISGPSGCGDYTRNTENEDSGTDFLSRMYLMVFECLEPEVGISINSDTDPAVSGTPVILYKDPSLRSRYFCSHEGGMHLINLQTTLCNFEDYVNCSEFASDAGSVQLGNSDTAIEYILCTKMNLRNTDFKLTRIVGFTVIETPAALLTVFLDDGKVILFNMESALWDDNDVHDMFQLSCIIKDDKSMKARKERLEMFMNRLVKNKLPTSDVSCKTIYNVAFDKEPTSGECLEFLTNELEKFKANNLKKLLITSEEFQKRNLILSSLQKKQLLEMQELNIKRDSLHENIEQLAEKFEDLIEKRDLIKLKYDKLYETVLSSGILSEEKFRNPFMKIADKISHLEAKLEGIQNEQKSMENKFEKTNRETTSQHELEASVLAAYDSDLNDIERRRIQRNMDDMASLIQKLNLRFSNL